MQAKVGETLTDWRLNGHWRVTAAAVGGRSGRQRRGETAPNATRPVLTEDIGDYRFAGNYLGGSALSLSYYPVAFSKVNQLDTLCIQMVIRNIFVKKSSVKLTTMVKKQCGYGVQLDMAQMMTKKGNYLGSSALS